MNTSTYFNLMSEFGTAQIPLEAVCKKYFNLSLANAKRAAAKQNLPVPAFKMKDKENGIYFIKAEMLAEHIDKQIEIAKEEWDLVNC